MIRRRLAAVAEQARYYAHQDHPLRALAADAGNRRRLLVMVAYGRAAGTAEVLAARLDVAAEVLHNGWVLAGRRWEQGMGLPSGHPDARFWSSRPGTAHCSYEVCTCVPDPEPADDYDYDDE